MRRYHIVLGSRIDVAATRAGIAARERPRHFMLDLADALSASVWEPAEDDPPAGATFTDRLFAVGDRARGLAARVAAEAGEDDVVFCNSESVSVSICGRLLSHAKRTKVASLAHNLVRPRAIATRWLTGALQRHTALYVVSKSMAARMRRSFGRGGPNVVFIEEQIDERFFSPQSVQRSHRPSVLSVGLEKRDYRMLAAAINGMHVDAYVSANSKDAALARDSFPDVLPQNMHNRFYPWNELVSQYRSVDVVVVPLQPCTYAAGITSILEAMAVGKPVVATATEGLSGIFDDAAGIVYVPPRDPDALRREIDRLLTNDGLRETLGELGRRYFLERHTMDDNVQRMAKRLRAL